MSSYLGKLNTSVVRPPDQSVIKFVVGKAAGCRKHLERLKRAKSGPSLWKSSRRRHDFSAEELRAIRLASLTTAEIHIYQMNTIIVNHGKDPCGLNGANTWKSGVRA